MKMLSNAFIVWSFISFMQGSEGFAVTWNKRYPHLYNGLVLSSKAKSGNEDVAPATPTGSSHGDLHHTSYKTIEIEEYEQYDRYLSPKDEKQQVEEEFGRKPIWSRVIERVSPTRKAKKGALILLRCGQSTFNSNHTFTGWMDPPLTTLGIQQSKHAGELLLSEGLQPDVVYTSRMQRAIVSTWNVLETMDSVFIPVRKTWRLNQRMYGALQGISKQDAANEFGPEVVQAWRNSLKARPPPLPLDDPSHPRFDRRYTDLPKDRVPDTESLLECQERARALWEYKIRKDIDNGRNVLVVAHRDSLRGLFKVIDKISDDDISEIAVPTGVPVVYRFDEHMKPLEPSDSSLSQVNTAGVFLEKPGRLEEALKRHAKWNEKLQVEGKIARTKSLEESLTKLRRVEDGLGDEIREATVRVDDDLIRLRPMGRVESNLDRWSDDPCEFEEYDEFADFGEDDDVQLPILPLKNSSQDNPKETGPFVVLIRHGRTPHNNMQLFTGWEDPPLASEGIEDARNAGRILKRHGFEFDVVYTSWLTRAIQTAYYCLDELESVWIPIVKSWRLNERMYGDLTGKSKKMISNEYGEEQLKKWRRGYTIRPPPVSSYSLSYPGNDERRAKHFKDLPISFRETINRSLEKRKLSVHRKFPKTESLKDCMDRSIPFYTQRIHREAVEKGKRVLITSHENAIRGILMHLCSIPEVEMNQLHLPNGLPLVYDVRGRCISLLDDGSGSDPMDSHDFGPAAKYLFQPCKLDDKFFEKSV